MSLRVVSFLGLRVSLSEGHAIEYDYVRYNIAWGEGFLVSLSLYEKLTV